MPGLPCEASKSPQFSVPNRVKRNRDVNKIRIAGQKTLADFEANIGEDKAADKNALCNKTLAARPKGESKERKNCYMSYIMHINEQVEGCVTNNKDLD